MSLGEDLLTNGGIVVALVLLEAVLSFDNAAILAALSRKLPLGEGRRRALNYGLAIAYGLRIGAILGAVVLLKFPVFITLGGLYLVFLFLKHFIGLLRGGGEEDHHKIAEGTPFLQRFGLSPFAAIIVQIGIVDLAFAMDQVVAAVGFTRHYLLIIIAAGIGLLALRLMAPYLSRLMDWLPSLEHIAYVAVGFVGVLLVLEDLPYFTVDAFFHGPPIPRFSHFEWHQVEIHLPTAIKVGITLGLFLVPILIKLVFKWPKSAAVPHHATVEESLREAGAPNLSVAALETGRADTPHESAVHRASPRHPPLPPQAVATLPEGTQLVDRSGKVQATEPGTAAAVDEAAAKLARPGPAKAKPRPKSAAKKAAGKPKAKGKKSREAAPGRSP